jgi:hypothetical protein
MGSDDLCCLDVRAYIVISQVSKRLCVGKGRLETVLILATFSILLQPCLSAFQHAYSVDLCYDGGIT